MRRLGLIMVAMSALAGCGGPAASATPDTCGEAFAAVARIHARMPIAYYELDKAVRACPTVEAWTAEFNANGGFGLRTSPTMTLRVLCGDGLFGNDRPELCAGSGAYEN